MPDRDDKSDPSEFDALRRRIDAARPPEPKRDPKAQTGGMGGIGQAFRLSSEFIAGIVVGGGIGWFIDEMLGTRPWGMIIFLLLGFCASILNVLRASGMMAESEMRLRPAKEMAERSKTDGKPRETPSDPAEPPGES